jgi:hypothetical protein
MTRCPDVAGSRVRGILYEEEIVLSKEFAKMPIENIQIGLDEDKKILNELKYFKK